MLRVVFDTQIYLRALINERSVCGRLFAEWTAHYVLYKTDQTEVELLGLLIRPKIRAKLPQITDETLNDARALLAKAQHVEVKPEDIERICRDPKDDIFLACANGFQKTITPSRACLLQ
jgi:predicted nucleic acid-binding protein